MNTNLHRAMTAPIAREPSVEKDWTTQAQVAPVRKQHCSGYFGRLCTCGEWHQQPEDGGSMFANPNFWVGLCVCVVAWTGLALALIELFKRMP